jgi:hypothetical protein
MLPGFAEPYRLEPIPATWREPARALTAECWAEGMQGGTYGGVGDSLSRQPNELLHQLLLRRRKNWVAKCPAKRAAKCRGSVATTLIPDSPATPGGFRLVQHNIALADVQTFAAALGGADPARNTTIVFSRGLWDAMNTGTPPSETHRVVSEVAAHLTGYGPGPSGTIRRVVVYVPHCAREQRRDHRATCGSDEWMRMYQRSVACAAAGALAKAKDSDEDTPRPVGSGGQLRLAVYDSCSVIAQDYAEGMRDAWHMTPRLRNRTLSMLLARFVCPAAAQRAGVDIAPSDEAGWYVDAPLVGGGAEGRRQRAAARAAIEARWDCTPFNTSRQSQSRKPARVPPKPDAWAWPRCPWSKAVADANNPIDAALGFEVKNECSCSAGAHSRAADGCWPSIMVGRRPLDPKRLNYAHEQVCRLRNTVGRDRCAPQPPTTLPLAMLRDAAALHELGVMGCVAIAAQGLCLYNLGATLLPGVPRDTLGAQLRADLNLSEAEGGAVCRCHTGTAAVNGTDWCRSYHVAAAAVRSVYREALGILSTEALRSPSSATTHRWVTAVNRSATTGTFGCDGPSLVYLPMCRYMADVHVPRSEPLSSRELIRALESAAREQFDVALPGISRRSPAFAEPW